MDVRLFAAVMSRFKKIAIAGAVAAIVLSGLAYMRSGGTPIYEAQSEVLITQPDDPYGAPTSAAIDASGYLNDLSSVYAAMANGDTVQAMALRAAGVTEGVVDASEVVDPNTGNPEPLLTLTSSAPTAIGAVKLAEKMPVVLQDYIASQQASAQIPGGLRVRLDEVKAASAPELASKSQIIVPLLVFMGITAAVITLIFMLENLNPQTAEKLGRVDPRTTGGNSELATVLAALVQNQHAVTGPTPSYNGKSNLHDQGPNTHHKPRALRLYEEPNRESSHEGAATDAPVPDGTHQALRNRLLRGRE